MNRLVATGLVILVGMLAFAILSGEEEAATAETGSSYNDGHKLPGVNPLLCLEPAEGFKYPGPIAEAAKAYEDTPVRIVIEADCSGYPNEVIVQSVRRDEGWAGWYNAPSANRDNAALISLNTDKGHITDDRWALILIHEIGHAVGLVHPDSSELDSIMVEKKLDEHTGLTDLDRQQLEELYRV